MISTRMLGGLAAAALAATGAVVPSGAAHAAGPAQDCAQPYAGTLSKGQAVTGLTVTEGTTPEQFTGTYVTTIPQGISSTTDMIVMELHSKAIDANGIWAGMSGSPVYDKATGDLIGAVSYTLSDEKSTIAGVTPFQRMRGYLPGATPAKAEATPKQKVRLSSLQSAKIAAASGESSGEMRMLATPLAVAGGIGDKLERLSGRAGNADRPYLHRDYIGRASAAAPGHAAPAESLVAGGNLAVAAVYGDIVFGAVGTVTSVCNGGLVGFGHPMDSTGKASLGLLAADADLVVSDGGQSYKQATLGDIAGTIDQDRTPAVGGRFGAAPAASRFTAKASYAGKSRSGASTVAEPYYTGDGAFSQTVNNNDTLLDAWYVEGGATGNFTVTGTSAGTPFTLKFANQYASSDDISSTSSYEYGDVVYALSEMSGVKVTGGNADVAFDDVTDTRKVGTVAQSRAGKWVTVDRTHPITAKAGTKVSLRVALPGSTGTIYTTTSFTVPSRLAGGSGTVNVLGGSTDEVDPYSVTSVDALRRLLGGAMRDDSVGVRTRVARSGVAAYTSSVKLGAFDRIVTGSAAVPIKVS